MSTRAAHPLLQRTAWPAVIVAVSVGFVASVLRLVGSINLAVQRPEFALTYTGGVVSWLSSNPSMLYHPIDQAPHVPTIYTPLYPALVNALAGATDLPVPILQRGVGLGAALVVGVLLAVIVHRHTGRRLAGAAAGMLYVLSPAVTRSTVLSRVDHLAVLFGVVALYFYLYHTDRARLAGAAGFSVLAVMTKQSLVVFPAAILLSLVVDRQLDDAKSLARHGAVFGVVFALPLMLETDGRVWVQTVLLNGGNPMILERLVGQLGWATYVHLPVLAIAACATWQYDRDQDWIPTIAPVLVVVGAGAALATMGKVGSWIGYTYPLVVGACLTVGCVVARLPGGWSAPSADLPRGVAVIGVLLAVQLAIYGAWAPSAVTQPDNQAEVAGLVADADGPVLSEDASLLTATGSEEAYEPLMMKYVAESGAWDEAQLATRIRAGEFVYIITWQDLADSRPSAGRWTELQKGAIVNHYTLDRTVGKYHIYTPAGSA